jgi:hypothetical protein
VPILGEQIVREDTVVIAIVKNGDFHQESIILMMVVAVAAEVVVEAVAIQGPPVLNKINRTNLKEGSRNYYQRQSLPILTVIIVNP